MTENNEREFKSNFNPTKTNSKKPKPSPKKSPLTILIKVDFGAEVNKKFNKVNLISSSSKTNTIKSVKDVFCEMDMELEVIKTPRIRDKNPAKKPPTKKIDSPEISP